MRALAQTRFQSGVRAKQQLLNVCNTGRRGMPIVPLKMKEASKCRKAWLGGGAKQISRGKKDGCIHCFSIAVIKSIMAKATYRGNCLFGAHGSRLRLQHHRGGSARQQTSTVAEVDRLSCLQCKRQAEREANLEGQVALKPQRSPSAKHFLQQGCTP